MIEYKFLNSYNFWPIPSKIYTPFDLKQIRSCGGIIDLVWGPANEWLEVTEYESRPEIRESYGSENNGE